MDVCRGRPWPFRRPYELSDVNCDCSGPACACCPSGEDMRSIANGKPRCAEVFEAPRRGRLVVLLQQTRVLDTGYVLGAQFTVENLFLFVNRDSKKRDTFGWNQRSKISSTGGNQGQIGCGSNLRRSEVGIMR